MLFSLTTSRNFILLLLTVLPSCTVSDHRLEEQLTGPISFPFGPTNAIGRDARKEPFTIRSNTGTAEYQLEFPSAGREFDVEIPVAVTNASDHSQKKSEFTEAKAVATDREMIAELPDIESKNGPTTYVLDKSMGVGKVEGGQGPSYTLGMARIRSFYAAKNYEYALIEVNNLLSFFPGSPILYKMKGSILLKLGQNTMAEKSWARALDYSPTDRTLQVALSRLRKRIEIDQMEPNNPKSSSADSNDRIAH